MNHMQLTLLPSFKEATRWHYYNAPIFLQSSSFLTEGFIMNCCNLQPHSADYTLTAKCNWSHARNVERDLRSQKVTRVEQVTGMPTEGRTQDTATEMKPAAFRCKQACRCPIQHWYSTKTLAVSRSVL